MAINPLLFSAGAAQAGQMPQTEPMSPEQAYLENMKKISSGDLKSVLTGGDRLLALSALLGSVARGSRTTPQEAIAQTQQTAANRVNMQMQMAQLEAKAAADAQLKRDQQTFIAKLPTKLQDTAKALRGESLDSFIKNLRINASYKRVIEDGKPVTKVVYGSGLEETADFQIPADSEKMFVNGKPIWVYKDTRTPVIDPATGQPLSAGDPIDPVDVARLSQNQQRIAISQANAARGGGAGRGGGGGSSGTLPEPKVVNINGRPTMMQWDRRSQRYVPFTGQNIQPAKIDPLANILSGGTTGPLFGGR